LLAQARSGLLRALRREAGESAALRRAAAIAASATPLVDPLQRILEVALPVLPADHVVLLHASTDRTESVILAAAGTAHVWRWLRAPLKPGVAARAIETGAAQFVSEVIGDAASAGSSMRSVLVVPVILRGTVFGVIEITDESGRLQRRHVTLLRAFANQCAIAIDNLRTGEVARTDGG
jgi:GAF domain-containing protein